MNTSDKIEAIINLPENKGLSENFDFWEQLLDYLLSEGKIKNNDWDKLYNLYIISSKQPPGGYSNEFILLTNLIYKILFKDENSRKN